ncbi:hypothetical protein ABZ402_38575 [Streptomyces mirabilis]|uniref:hypothetical protein n=1 Tax=Streptomyces mirabilis TaxID=68239 RepID=UPI00340335DD
MRGAPRTLLVDQGSLSRIMNGDRGTSPVLVKALLDCYGVTEPAVREDSGAAPPSSPPSSAVCCRPPTRTRTRRWSAPRKRPASSGYSNGQLHQRTRARLLPDLKQPDGFEYRRGNAGRLRQQRWRRSRLEELTARRSGPRRPDSALNRVASGIP